jgi:transcriptional regulator with XRE-family HTH domain
MSVGKDIPLVQKQLARELARLRSIAGLDQREVAARITGISQATVSRAERGLKLLPLPQVLAWAEVCGASQDDRNRLTALTQATFTQTEAWRDLLPKTPQLQDAVLANEATTRTLLNYSPTVIPGLLQTPAYAEQVLRLTNYTGQMNEAASLAGRWRRQEALTDRSRHFGFVLPEAVLRWSPAEPTVMASQLDRMTTVAAQENVAIGIIRPGAEAILPLHGFVIYADRGDEDPFVVVELVHTYITENNPVDVALYQELYERMASAAVLGDEARVELRRIADEYRAMT